MSKGGAGFTTGAALGCLIGAGLGLLFAPQSGEQLRRDVASWRRARRSGAERGNGVDEMVDLGAGLVEAVLDRVSRAAEASREAREASRQQLAAEWEESRRRA